VLEELTDGDRTVDVDALGAEVGAALDGVEDAPSVLLGMIDDVVSTEGVVVSVDVEMPEVAGMSSAAVRGAVRRGELLLPGLLRCGHCGRKLHVHYSGKLGGYNCYGARVNHGTPRCISISSGHGGRPLVPGGDGAAVGNTDAQNRDRNQVVTGRRPYS